MQRAPIFIIYKVGSKDETQHPPVRRNIVLLGFTVFNPTYNYNVSNIGGGCANPQLPQLSRYTAKYKPKVKYLK